MSLPIHVDAYSGYKASERPRQFVLDEQIYQIGAVLDQWCEPTATYFKVQTVEGKTYLLRYDEQTDEWASMVTICWRGQLLNWSPSIPIRRRRPNSELNPVSTAIQMMPRFRSTGFSPT